MTRKKKDRKASADEAVAEEESEAAAEAELLAASQGSPELDLQAQRDALQDKLLWALAEHENYKKRAQKEAAQAREFANESIVKELLAVLDDMERALDAARENHGEDDPLFTGMQLVHDKALEALGRFGLARIEAAGRPFDPALHAAMMQEESENAEPMTVLREVRRGYQFKGRTIRPSGVVVAKAPEEAPAEAEQGEES
jgi:molecular chaperone GrpE